jgi:myosin heavy subunit
MLEDGNYAQTKRQLLFQRNPGYREFNPDRWDLMDTDLLNEPEVLQTLKFRLLNNRIYTFV